MQQRKNFADAKTKIVDHVKQNYIEPLKDDGRLGHFATGMFTPEEIKNSGGFDIFECPVEGCRNLDPHKHGTRADNFETGVTEHLATVTGMDEFKEKKANRQLTENNNE